jgi:hypothetical protein
MLIISRQPIGTERSEKTAFTIGDSLIQVISTDTDNPRMVMLTIDGDYRTMKVGDFLPFKGGRIHIRYVSARCVRFGLDYPKETRIERADYKPECSTCEQYGSGACVALGADESHRCCHVAPLKHQVAEQHGHC